MCVCVYQNTVTVWMFFELKINKGLRKVPGYKSKDFFLSPTRFGYIAPDVNSRDILTAK